MTRTKQIGIFLFLFVGILANAQTLVWTGASADNNFFTEGNWKDSVTNAIPAANSINPATNINLILQIDVASTITASGTIQFGTGSLTIGSTTGSANLSATAFSGGNLTINENAYLNLSSNTPFLDNIQINFTSGIGWIKTTNYLPKTISTNNLTQIKVNNIAAVYQTNLRLDNYYEKGCIIRANIANTTPLKVHDNANLAGVFGMISVNTIHSDNAIASNMNNKIESFILKRGFMVTLANEFDGTGKSKNYIASENDLVINTLPYTLSNSISFIRVLPWNWVTKKGRNVESDTGYNTTWRYQWNPNDSSTLDYEFAPMAWGGMNADDAGDINLLIGKYNSPYVMSFNEPDDCGGQSGQWGNPKLCTISQAVKLHKNLMKTGMRIVSPGGREEAPKAGKWLELFYDEATAQDVRIDVIAVHWYDWGSNPVANPNPTALQVFNRFKTYLTEVHNKYGLPIWITEFNANPARSQAINAGFLELALPYLESLDYIERYCWFPFNQGTHFSGWNDTTNKETDKIPSLVGIIYKNINNTTPEQSTPAVPEAVINDDNNLNLIEFPNIALNKPATASSNYQTYTPSKAVDGDKTNLPSRWLVAVNNLPLNAWIEIDLQDSFLVDSFRLTEMSNAVKDFKFEVWDATLNSGSGGWSTALTVTGNPASSLVTFQTITPVSTTKVRLLVTAHNDSSFMRLYEIEVFGQPSSPVWTGTTSSNWTTASNWSTSKVPNELSNVSIPGGRPFQPNISTSENVKTLTIETGASLNVATGVNLTVDGDIRNFGTMTVASGSNLLQGEAYNNNGNVNIIRNSSALSRLDYTIWSSPVTNPNQFLTTFSPLTSTNRFYVYDNWVNTRYNKIVSPSTTNFALCSGYLIRMPDNAVASPATENFAGVFNGIPNNGIIVKNIDYWNTPSFAYHLVGNPYPSTLDASKFVTANASRLQNSSLYFWRKKNGQTGSAYALWNSLGGTASGTGSAIPNGTIEVGQGFFVSGKRGSNSITFTNDMRLGTTSSQFFKTKQVEKDRLWLNLTTSFGVFSQILIGFIQEAKLEVDDFDAVYINDSPIALTSNINNQEYTIQALPPFEPTDVVLLNFKTNVDDNYKISLDNVDGVFNKEQAIFLMDNKTGIETNLKSSDYNFTADSGIDNQRFVLKFQKTLGINNNFINENSITVYKRNKMLFIKSETELLSNIKVLDLQGKLIAHQKNL